MSREEQGSSDKQFYAVFDGAFRTKVREDYPDAIKRINKLGTQVYERELKAIFGRIENVAIEDSDYGKQIKITLDKNDEGKYPVLAFGVESKNGRDVLKKLPGIDFSKDVRVMPYRFTPEDQTDERSGVSITQEDAEGNFKVKVENFFFDGVNKKYLHEFPTIDWDSATESEQKIYKIQRDEFLLKYVETNVLPRFAEKPVQNTYPTEEIRPEDIPF